MLTNELVPPVITQWADTTLRTTLEVTDHAVVHVPVGLDQNPASMEFIEVLHPIDQVAVDLGAQAVDRDGSSISARQVLHSIPEPLPRTR